MCAEPKTSHKKKHEKKHTRRRTEHITIAESSDQNIRPMDEMSGVHISFDLCVIIRIHCEHFACHTIPYHTPSKHDARPIIDEIQLNCVENDSLFRISLINVFVSQPKIGNRFSMKIIRQQPHNIFKPVVWRFYLRKLISFRIVIKSLSVGRSQYVIQSLI